MFVFLIINPFVPYIKLWFNIAFIRQFNEKKYFTRFRLFSCWLLGCLAWYLISLFVFLCCFLCWILFRGFFFFTAFIFFRNGILVAFICLLCSSFRIFTVWVWILICALSCTLSCTLEEIAVLNFLREQPKATQKEIAAHIGKSERTIKTITVNLSEKGIIERKNGKRNGFWEIKTNDLTR